MSVLLLASLALATPEVVLVGIHIPGLVGNEADRAEDRLEEALKAAALQPVGAAVLAPILAGKEGLLIEDYALGPGKQLVQEARILYDRAQPAEAIPPLLEGIEMLGQALQFAGSGRELQDALLLLALCYLANGEEGPAKEAFSRAATLDPLRTLENASYSPEARSLFEEAKGRVSAQTTGRLWVIASADAKVYLDGREIGASPVQDFPVGPGDHTVVARGPKGSTFRDDVRVEASKTTRVEAALELRNLGQAQESSTGRSLQTRYLYQALGRYSEAELILIGGVLDGKSYLQFYDPQSASFSRVVTVEPGSDAVGSLVDSVPKLAEMLDDGGNIRPDRVSPQVAPLDVGANDLLAGLLLDPPKVEVQAAPSEKKAVPWFVWAGIGAVVAGGGAATAAMLLTPEPSGTITVGPIP